MQERGNGIIRIIPDKLGLFKERKQVSFDEADKLAHELELDLICINEEQLIFTISNKEKLDYYNKKHKPAQKRKELKILKIKGSIESMIWKEKRMKLKNLNLKDTKSG